MSSDELKNWDRKKEKTRNTLIVIIVILTLLNGYFALNNFINKRKNKILQAKKTETDSLYAQVTAELALAAAALDSLKGKNRILDSLIAIREKELAETKKQIEELLRKNQLTLIDLSQVRKLVRELYDEHQKHIQHIHKLQEKNRLLAQENDSLHADLLAEKAITKLLTEEKAALSKKAFLGSLIKPVNITGIGVKINGNKEHETSVARKAEKLKICFDITQSIAAEPGQNEIHIRIINPLGSTLAISSQGSGTLTDAQSGETVPFTTSAIFHHDNTPKTICSYWQQNTAYGKGTYRIMLYHRGYLVGEGTFLLR